DLDRVGRYVLGGDQARLDLAREQAVLGALLQRRAVGDADLVVHRLHIGRLAHGLAHQGLVAFAGRLTRDQGAAVEAGDADTHARTQRVADVAGRAQLDALVIELRARAAAVGRHHHGG